MATLHDRAPGAPGAPAEFPAPPLDDDQAFEFNDFEAELQKLAAANQELLAGYAHAEEAVPELAAETLPLDEVDEREHLRDENRLLRARVAELEAMTFGQADELWQERQREYEMLLEEKSEVIRTLHQRIHELQEAGAHPESAPTSSAAPVGQAEEILRLKRELEEQRKQLEQDEEDMMTQLRQMEMTMAKERAEMARQRQEILRLQAELAREQEQASRDSGLRDKLHSLRRGDGKSEDDPAKKEQKSSGFFRRIFG